MKQTKLTKRDKNIACPFCESLLKAKQVSNLELSKVNNKMHIYLKSQGFELRKKRVR